jgi:hypothetical protein
MRSLRPAFSSTIQISRRHDQAMEFYRVALDADELPYFVSDEATLYDLYAGDENELIDKCQHHYGVELRREHFLLPVWELLDYLSGSGNN